MTVREPVLVLQHVAKRFGSFPALVDASLSVRPGTVHALLGENGAGKTTLMRLAFGLLTPDAGECRVRGVARSLRSPADAIALGIGMVHQHFTIVPTMTVAENVALGGHGYFDLTSAEQRVRDVSAATGLHLDPEAGAGSLPVSAQQRLEIIKALARDVRILILDEPTAVLAPSEADELLRWLRSFASVDRSVVLITHKLREAVAIADEVTVLRRGTTTFTRATSDVSENDIVRAMIGEAQIAQATGSSGATPGDVAIIARDLRIADERGVVRIDGASLEVRRGEIVGLVGVEGAGHRELLGALSGRIVPSGGTLTMPKTIGFIPEDRQQDALIPDMTLAENVALRDAGRRHGWIHWRAIASHTTTLLSRFDVRAPDAQVFARTLSGGNQQKLVFGRELEGPPVAVVVANPTRGLDIRAAAFVFQELRAARNAGVAVVFYSADLDEVLAIADRVIVVYAGNVSSVPNDRAVVGRAMLGAA
jgi:ABC-type uncharacterized transport system ATPase subunit